MALSVFSTLFRSVAQVDQEGGRIASLYSQVESTVAYMDEVLRGIQSASSLLEAVDAPETDSSGSIQAFLSEGSTAVAALEVHHWLPRSTPIPLLLLPILLCFFFGMAWHGMAWHGMVWYGMVG